MTDTGDSCPHCRSTATIRIREGETFCLACCRINGQLLTPAPSRSTEPRRLW